MFSTRLKEIKLVFDKNVVNDLVWSNNRKQIRMFKGSERIAIRVRRIPDTLDFSKRRNIYVRPVNALAPNTKYTIVLLADLTSKAGEKLGKSVVISFTTGKKAAVTPTVVVQE
ncbi:hypothetical protein Swol_2468 [Syntrophomonas wolfei subsp. wolfei str. Goettingen G311]|uniref:SbsA Ig-like domain-containing protein n=2 Tax=Syntrophomonas wolfei TaxID=863 RepID=Q0AU47_SYNWW|nr:hypothetical protein Swol_2468 [Syntrophomonas wolfei subsp. wolfei str. Goettingen G311]